MNKCIVRPITDRRSVRSFDRSSIDQDTIKRILYAALLAPSPKNRQPWLFTVVTTSEIKTLISNIMIDKIKILKESNNNDSTVRIELDNALITSDIILNSPILILVQYRNNATCLDDGLSWSIMHNELEALEIQSIGASVENMLIEATANGLGSLWVGDIMYAGTEISTALNLKYPLISAVVLGHSEKKSAKSTRKKMKDIVDWR